MAGVVGAADDKELVLPLSRLVSSSVGCRLALLGSIANLGVQTLLRQELVAELKVHNGRETLMLLDDLDVGAVEQLIVGIVIRVY